jgi:hypothetical protein
MVASQEVCIFPGLLDRSNALLEDPSVSDVLVVLLVSSAEAARDDVIVALDKNGGGITLG